MNVLEQAQAFFEKAREMTREALDEATKLLPKDVQKAYWKLRKASYFAPENEIEGSRKEILSPSGKYKLMVSHFSTGPNTWSYSQGVVYRKDDDKPIATVQRNYGSFPNLFIEAHPNGHDYVVCGEDYQGATIIELDTGKRLDLMSDGSNKGVGFCWASYEYNAPNEVLIVCGCIWACPYEHRFYDFSDPMSGWPEIKPEQHIEADEQREPELDLDGTLRCFMTRYIEDEDHEEDTDEEKAKVPPAPIVDVLRTYKREGLRFKLVEEWISDYEKDRQKKREEWERKDREWTANFKATDPLYLTYAELVEDPELSPEDYHGVGITYDGWGGDWKGNEKRWCRRIVSHKGKTGLTIDLEWAVETGPIKLVRYRDGDSAGDKFFEHSTEGMKQAFAYAKEFARS